MSSRYIVSIEILCTDDREKAERVRRRLDDLLQVAVRVDEEEE